MMRRYRVDNEEGYTMMEICVAMALFLGVVLPLVGLLGNYFSKNTSLKDAEAFRYAQKEITRVEREENPTDRDTVIAHGIRVERRVMHNKSLCEILVTVSDTGSTKKYITLEKLLQK